MEDVLGDEQHSCNRKLQLGNRFYQSQQLITTTTTKTSKMTTTTMMMIFGAVAIFFILPLQTQGMEILQSQTHFENNDNVIVDNTDTHTETILNEINDVPELKNLPQDVDMEDLEESIRNSVKTEIEMEKNTSTSALLNVIKSIPEADLRETLTQDMLSTDYIPKNQNQNEKYEVKQETSRIEEKERETVEKETLAKELADEPEHSQERERESRNLINDDREETNDIVKEMSSEVNTKRHDDLIETLEEGNIPVQITNERKLLEEASEQKQNIEKSEIKSNEMQNESVATNSIQSHKNEISNSLEAVQSDEFDNDFGSAQKVSDMKNVNSIKTDETNEDVVMKSAEVNVHNNGLESTINENDENNENIVQSVEEENHGNVNDLDTDETKMESNIVNSLAEEKQDILLDSKEEVQETEENITKSYIIPTGIPKLTSFIEAIDMARSVETENNVDEDEDIEPVDKSKNTVSIDATEIMRSVDTENNKDEDEDTEPIDVSENMNDNIKQSIENLSREEKLINEVLDEANNTNRDYQIITQTISPNEDENDSGEFMTVVLNETLSAVDESDDTSEIHLTDLENTESDVNTNSTVEQSKHNIIKKPGVETVTDYIQTDEMSTLLPNTPAIPKTENGAAFKNLEEDTVSNESQEERKSSLSESTEEYATPETVEIPLLVDQPTLDKSNTVPPQTEQQENNDKNIEISNESETEVHPEFPPETESKDETVSVGSATVASAANVNSELHTVEVDTELLLPSTKGSRSIYTANNGVEDSASTLFDADHLYNNNLAAENSADIDKALLTRNVHDDTSQRSAIIIVICSSTALLFIVISVTIFLISFQRQHGTLDIEMQEQRCGKDNLDEEDAETHTKLLEVEVPSTVTISTEETDECL